METDMPGYLIAPPGTPVGAPGWRKPPPGMVLTWTLTEGPDVAVQRDVVLIADGRNPEWFTPGASYPDPVKDAISRGMTYRLPGPLLTGTGTLYLYRIAADLADEDLDRLTAPCPHLTWWWGDRGDHGCTDCPLTHQFPHAPGENPADCEER